MDTLVDSTSDFKRQKAIGRRVAGTVAAGRSGVLPSSGESGRSLRTVGPENPASASQPRSSSKVGRRLHGVRKGAGRLNDGRAIDTTWGRHGNLGQQHAAGYQHSTALPQRRAGEANRESELFR